MKDYRSLSHTKWDCKYHVVFLDEVVVREYIRNQEKEDKRLEQLNLDWSSKARISKTAPL